jgi:TP901 family phage tail tape measure protein
MALPKLFLEIIGVPGSAIMATEEVSKSLDGMSKKGNSSFDKLAKFGGAAFKAISIGGAALAITTVSMAANFQQSTSRLVTDGGEAASSLSAVQNGILSMMGQVGDTSADLVSGMNTVESAGFHLANGGLTVLKVAAEGAKVGNADLQTTANALTSQLNAYGQSASSAGSDMNMMIATVAAGKMHMEDLAGSISNVLPVAAAAHIQFGQIGGALATMTSQGMSTDQATQDLANTIRSLQNPNQTAIKEMQALGLNSNKVADQLGTKGLTGTLSELTGAIASHVKGSDVFISSLKNSQIAAADAKTMISQMPASLQATAQAFLNGTMTTAQWTAKLKTLPPLQNNLAAQFATTAKSANGFNDLLKSGSPQAQTFSGALSDMLGGATGLNTALMLTGTHMTTFQSNVAAVTAVGKKGGDTVKDWATVQKNFNQQIDVAKAKIEALGIKIGMVLMPYAQKLLNMVESLVGWFGKHKDVTIALASVIGGILSIAIGAYFIQLAKGMVENAKKAIQFAKDLGTSFGKVTSALGKIPSGISNLASSAQSGFQAVALKAVYAKDKFLELASSAGTKLASMGSTIAGWASSAGQAMLSAGRAVIQYGIKLAGMAVEAAQAFIAMAADALTWAGEMVVAGATALLPFLPIILAVAAVAAAAYLLYRYWDQVWGFIKGVGQAAWRFLDNDVFQPIIRLGFWYIRTEIKILLAIWSAIWTGLKDTALDAWNFLDDDVIEPLVHLGLWLIKTEIHDLETDWSLVWGAITGAARTASSFLQNDILKPLVNDGLDPVKDGISLLQRVWSAVWSGIQKVVQGVWSVLRPIFNSISKAASDVGGAISGVANLAGKVTGGIGDFGKMLGFADGGVVPGPKGQPQLAIVHGGEYVVSNEMLSGQGGGGLSSMSTMAGAGGGTTIIVQAAGSILTMNDIYQEIRTLFLQDGRRLPSTWPSTSAA